MKKSWLPLTTMLVLLLGAVAVEAGTISYVAIPATQSDNNCGVSRDHGYTTAVDAGNTRGADRVLNGITLYALTGAGQNSATADNCTVNALSGTLTDAGVTGKNVQADGTLRDVLSDMVLNNAGGDNSQLEIVLDPESLEQGSTYDLRVYICSSSGQNRQVNLAFFGDGQNAAETGFFNEDDNRSSAGGFQSPYQVYYINFRYTWDGDSTPGITITQKSGGAPFCLYALTNELVGEGGGGAAAAGAAGGGGGEAAGEGEEGGEGLTSGLVENQESDEVGVESDDFYGSESLNSHGRWIKLSKWGTCWQPTDVQSGWSPYTNGNWKECDDCGWTFVSDEPWAWACYHYGRWCKVRTGCGWAWVPGKVWAASWVSWRQGRDESCSCLGWAPLPPEAGCQLGIGISSWVDSTCNIGPECYTFINIRDFGSDSYWGCGCIYERSRNTTIIIDTFNCTNIWHTRRGTYCGGPDYNWCNTQIRKQGGKECGKVYVNRYDNPGKLGGKFAKHEGNQLGLVSPHIKGEKNPKHMPKTAESLGSDKIDHGWSGIKDKKQERELRNHIAQETKGKTPRNSPAKLPSDVAEKVAKHGGRQAGGQMGQGAGGGNVHPGGKGKAQGLQAGGGQGQTGAGFDQHPGGKGKRKEQAGGANASVGGRGQGQGGTGFDQHPGKGKTRGRGQAGNAGAGGNTPSGGNQQTGMAQGGGRHPGQSLKKQKGAQGGAGAGSNVTQGTAGEQRGGKGKRKAGQGAGQAGNESGAGGMTEEKQGGGGRGKSRHKQQQGQGQMEQAGASQQSQGQTAGGGRRGKTHTKQQQVQGQGQAQDAGQGGGGQGQTGHRKQQQTQQSGQSQGQGEGAGGGQGRRQQQHVQQQQQQGGGGGGGGGRGKRARPTPTPHR